MLQKIPTTMILYCGPMRKELHPDSAQTGLELMSSVQEGRWQLSYIEHIIDYLEDRKRRRLLKRTSITGVMMAVMFSLSACSGNREKDIQESLQEEALNTETDTFYVDDLISLIGKDKESVSELQGLEQKEENIYNTQLFGENITLEVECDERQVKSINITFADADAGPLENAIAEQLGADPVEKDDEIIWDMGEVTIQLDEEGKENIVIIKEN